MSGLKPDTRLDVAALKNGAHGNSEFALAGPQRRGVAVGQQVRERAQLVLDKGRKSRMAHLASLTMP